jgi:hypothetical protein
VSRTGWKRAERAAAALLGGRRHPANVGGLVDAESDGVVAQVKERKHLSLAQLEALAVEIARVGGQKDKAGIVMVKRSAGRGVPTPWLIVMTEDVWRYMNGPLPTPAGAGEKAQ